MYAGSDGALIMTQEDINAYMGTDEYKMYAWQVLAIFAYLYHQPGMPIAH
jgi:hypothetical protein